MTHANPTQRTYKTLDDAYRDLTHPKLSLFITDALHNGSFSDTNLNLLDTSS